MSALVATLTSTINSIGPVGASMMLPAPNAVCLRSTSRLSPDVFRVARVFWTFTSGDSISIQTLLAPAGTSCVKVSSSAVADVAVNPVTSTAPPTTAINIGLTLRRLGSVLYKAIVSPQG